MSTVGPMPGSKRDIDGFSEGDRVRLTVPFQGQSSSYPAGSLGTILITSSSVMAQVMNEQHWVEVNIDDGGIAWVKTVDIERIPGRAQVTYGEDGETVTVALP
jgi:hypothetical protein